jgi:hypothetical protein
MRSEVQPAYALIAVELMPSSSMSVTPVCRMV